MDGLDVKLETITPKQASAYLKLNLENNRTISKRWVGNIALLMEKGQWDLNGETIKFSIDENGQEVLIDGQHRLMAIVQYGKPFNQLVVRGLPVDTFKTIDSGRKRQAHDVLKIMGHSQTTLLAAAARILTKYKADPFFYNLDRSVPTPDILQTLKEHPKLEESCSIGHRGRYLAPGSMLVFLHYILRESGYEMAINDFCVKLADGVSMVQGDPVLTFRERIMRVKASGSRINRRMHFGMLLKTWNYTLDQKAIEKLKFKPDDEIPYIHGVLYDKLFGKEHPTRPTEDERKEKDGRLRKNLTRNSSQMSLAGM